MRLNTLELRGFRNLQDQNISFPGRICTVVGKNGQGKTSLLEAIFLLSHAKSFRAGTINELVRWGDSVDSSVQGDFETTDGRKTLTFSIVGGKREISLNSNKVKKASLFYGQSKSVVFTPDDLQLVKGAPILRRGFIDRILAMIDPMYVEHLVHYQRALKSRNSILQKRSMDSYSGIEEIEKVLIPWNILLVQHGLKIAGRRLEFILELEKGVKKYYEYLLGDLQEGRVEKANCSFQSQLTREGQLLDEDELLGVYQRTINKDIRYGSSTIGPHRDDLELQLDCGSGVRNSKRTASQGQARCIALALKLSAIDIIADSTGEAPLLLLDDVESELDQGRRRALYELLESVKNQIILSTTDLSSSSLSKLKEAMTLEIEQGRVIS